MGVRCCIKGKYNSHQEVDAWGSIAQIVHEPPIDVKGDESWLSVLGMWITLPLNLLVGLFGGLCKRVFVCYSIGTCCVPCSDSLCSVLGSTRHGRSLCMAWVWWRYVISGLIALLSNAGSRLGLFLWEWDAFGAGKNWYHGTGFWSWTHAECDSILQEEQQRSAAFGCMNAPVPDLFASNILIFLSNDGSNSEWAALRNAVHTFFLNMGSSTYQHRLNTLTEVLATDEDWQNPQLSDLNDASLVQRSVSKCVFYMMFGIWLDRDDASILTGWRTTAGLFILPRLVQRFMFNFGIRQVQKLREGTVGLIEKHGLQGVFTEMNSSLPEPYRRDPVVKLCDEIMFVIGFAGVGGTCAATESVGAFLQLKKPSGSAASEIDFGQFKTSADMVAEYTKNPEAHIRETCRLDPPVTSATRVIEKEAQVDLAGRPFDFPPGTLNQYVVSMANRDESIFHDPKVFRPERDNLHKALTWNGQFSGDATSDEQRYPRICPGRYMSLQIAQAVIDRALSHSPATA
jgi:hypothetical protein